MAVHALKSTHVETTPDAQARYHGGCIYTREATEIGFKMNKSDKTSRPKNSI